MAEDNIQENVQDENLEQTDTVEEQEETTEQAENIEEESETQEEETIEWTEEDVNKFNKFFESKYENADQLKTDLSNLSKIKEFDDLKANHEKLTLSNKELTEQTDKLRKERQEYLEYDNLEKQFGGKENYRNIMIMRKAEAEGKNPSVVRTILSNDIKSMDNLEKASYGKMLNIPDMPVDEAAELVLRTVALDKERFNEIKEELDNNGELFNILTASEKGALREMATNAERDMMAVKNTEVPEYKNLEERINEKEATEKEEREKLINSWSDTLNKIRDSIPPIQFVEKDEKTGKEEVVYETPIDKNVIEKFPEWATNKIVSENIPLTEENINTLRDRFVDEYGAAKWREIVSASRNDLRTRLTEEYFKKTKNAEPFNTKKNNENVKKDVEASQKAAFGYK